MPHRAVAEDAEIAYRHAVRTAESLEKELYAWMGILKSSTAMIAAAGVRS